MNARSVILALLLLAFTASIDAAPSAKVEHATIELIAEKNSFVPGTREWVGIAISHEPNWHTYWINPGDSGLPTKLQWQLPQDFHAGEIAWPVPKRFDLGGLYNFGYDGDLVLPVPIDVPATAQPGSLVAIALNAKWLICSHEICLPGKASLNLSVPITSAIGSTNAAAAPLFALARATLPKPAAWQGAAKLSGDRVHIELSGKDLPNMARLDVFSIAANVIENAPPKIGGGNGRLVVDAAKSDYLETIPSKLTLLLTDTSREPPIAWTVEVPLSSTSDPSKAAKAK